MIMVDFYIISQLLRRSNLGINPYLFNQMVLHKSINIVLLNTSYTKDFTFICHSV